MKIDSVTNSDEWRIYEFTMPKNGRPTIVLDGRADWMGFDVLKVHEGGAHFEAMDSGASEGDGGSPVTGYVSRHQFNDPLAQGRYFVAIWLADDNMSPEENGGYRLSLQTR